MPIFDTNYLNALAVDAEQQINQDVPCIYSRFYLAITAGLSVYTLPSFVRSVKRISFFGRKLDPVSWEELQLLSPATVFVNASLKIETTQSRPFYYAMHPTNPYDVRFHPCPAQTFSATGGDPYSPIFGESRCIVSCLRSIDSTFTDPTALIPLYADRRTRKAYILWKAFESEGKGQSLEAAKYYKLKYQFLVRQFEAINNYAFISKKYTIEDGMLSTDAFRYPKPTLPPTFERTLF